MKCDERRKNHKHTNHGQTFKKYVKTITIFEYWPLKIVIIYAIETTTLSLYTICTSYYTSGVNVA